jgi:Domain of unknown function (DUF4350)
MKERLVTLALAVGALALFWLLLFPKPEGPSRAPRPMATGADDEGYAAAFRWLKAAGVPTRELYKRFDQTGDGSLNRAGSGNLLITTLPYGMNADPGEYPALEQWIEQGNVILVLAALDDTPLWSALSSNFAPEVQKVSNIEFTALKPPATGAATADQGGVAAVLSLAGGTVVLHPSGRIPLLEGVRQLATLTPLPSEQWRAEAMDASPVLELARRADTADPVLWLKSSGHGAVIVSAYASLFTNKVIDKADNARLLSNIVAWSVRHGGQVIFDDGHQGALDEYNASQFFADPRLHHTLLWLVALWLAWVLAAQPLRASPRHVASLDEGAMLRVTARFFAGVLRPVASARWLMDEFFDRLRRRHGLQHSTSPPWDWLAARAGVSSGLLAELRELYARTQAGNRVNLVRLQQILSQISGRTS